MKYYDEEDECIRSNCDKHNKTSEFKYRIKEKRIKINGITNNDTDIVTHSEFHPQFCIDTEWHSLLVGTDKFEHGLNTIEEAQEWIDNYRYPNTEEEIIHEVD